MSNNNLRVLMEGLVFKSNCYYVRIEEVVQVTWRLDFSICLILDRNFGVDRRIFNKKVVHFFTEKSLIKKFQIRDTQMKTNRVIYYILYRNLT